MKYQELVEEYAGLLRSHVHMRTQMQEIPKGYIVAKKISGKEYFYLQYSSGGKKKSEYIRDENVAQMRTAIAMRDPLKRQLEVNEREQMRLEAAAKILDTNLFRIFVFLKQCAEMDALPVAKRTTTLKFAGAMTALEGLPAKPETLDGMADWAKGQCSYVDVYMKALCNYRVVEVSQ